MNYSPRFILLTSVLVLLVTILQGQDSKKNLYERNPDTFFKIDSSKENGDYKLSFNTKAAKLYWMFDLPEDAVQLVIYAEQDTAKLSYFFTHKEATPKELGTTSESYILNDPSYVSSLTRIGLIETPHTTSIDIHHPRGEKPLHLRPIDRYRIIEEKQTGRIKIIKNMKEIPFTTKQLTGSIDSIRTLPINVWPAYKNYENFSDEYYAYHICEPGLDLTGEVVVREKRTGKRVLWALLKGAGSFQTSSKSVNSEGFVPMGRWAKTIGLVYQDFNFDGKKDIAFLEDFTKGPRYSFFLNNGSTFQQEESFSTEVVHGLFSIDYDKELLYTSQVGGCCDHWFSEFKIKDNELIENCNIAESTGRITVVADLKIKQAKDSSHKMAFVPHYSSSKAYFIQSFDIRKEQKQLTLFADSSNGKFYCFITHKETFFEQQEMKKHYDIVDIYAGEEVGKIDSFFLTNPKKRVFQLDFYARSPSGTTKQYRLLEKKGRFSLIENSLDGNSKKRKLKLKLSNTNTINTAEAKDLRWLSKLKTITNLIYKPKTLSPQVSPMIFESVDE